MIPLSYHPLFRSQDIDDTRAQVARVFCDHRLNPLQRSSSFHALQNRVALQSSALNFLQYGAPVRIEPGELQTFFLIQIPISGQARVACGTETHLASTVEASVLSSTGKITMEWDGDCRQVIVWLDRVALEQHLCEILGNTLRTPLRFHLGMSLRSSQGQLLMRTVRFLLNEFERKDSYLKYPGVLIEVERMMMSSLLYLQPHNYSEAISRACSNLAPTIVRDAEAYISEHVFDEISIDDLALHVGVSTRSLYENFKKFRGTSPFSYLRELRLKGVRRDLQRATRNETVTSIALRWRFNELGRFSHTYRQRFGESPSETLRKLKRCARHLQGTPGTG